MASTGPGFTPRIPDYDLLRLVGHGAYGDVWLARSLTGVLCAVKVIWRDRFPDPIPYELEFGGLSAFAQLSPGRRRQLALLHVGRNERDGYFYYVMELADDVDAGRGIDPDHYTPLTLKRWFQHEGPQPSLRDVIDQAVNLAQGLANLHASGLVHRDIKPSNLLMIQGRATLADIGLVANSTPDAAFVGTEGFVAPEGAGTPQADVYSLGKVLYELVTGRDRLDYPRLPDNLRERTDRRELLELNEIVVRACHPDPAQRHPDGNALLEELLLLQTGGSVRHLREAERRTHRAHRIATVLALAAVLAILGAVYQSHRAHREGSARRLAEAQRDDAIRRVADPTAVAYSTPFGTAQVALAELSAPSPSAALAGMERPTSPTTALSVDSPAFSGGVSDRP